MAVLCRRGRATDRHPKATPKSPVSGAGLEAAPDRFSQTGGVARIEGPDWLELSPVAGPPAPGESARFGPCVSRSPS